MTTSPMRITHVITSLDMGGAEMMLFHLVKALKERQLEQLVICLRPAGFIASQLTQIGIRVVSLGMNPGLPTPNDSIRLVRLIKEQRPDILHTWMYHADLLGSLAALLAGRPPAIWGIHNADLSPKATKMSTRIVVWCLAILSHWLPRKIVVCSENALKFHTGLGYDRKKMIFIPNGFDLNAYTLLPDARNVIREELAIPHNAFLIGLVARFHPDKDPGNFILAAASLAQKYLHVYFVMAGEGFTYQNIELSRLIPTELRSRLKMIGLRSDISQIMNALDLFTLSSASEAFPLTIGEAMACGIPCVATNVGDTKRIIGETGLVVPRQDSEALSAAWEKMMALTSQEREHLGNLARERIAANYSIETVIEKYVDLYCEV